MRPLTDEQSRILYAARRGDLYENEHGRYVIAGNVRRPDRKERERLMKRGLLMRSVENSHKLVPTWKGEDILGMWKEGQRA